MYSSFASGELKKESVEMSNVKNAECYMHAILQASVALTRHAYEVLSRVIHDLPTNSQMSAKWISTSQLDPHQF